MELPEIYTEKEAADFLKIPRSTLRLWRRRGCISFISIGKHVRYNKVHLMDFLENCSFNVEPRK